jgi:hypothetical protein
MKYLVTVVACFVLVSVSAQTPYNPDSDSDNLIGFDDLLDFLPLYGSEFFPEPDEPEIFSLDADILTSLDLDTLDINSIGVTLEYVFHVDNNIDIVVIEADEIRLAMADMYSTNNQWLDIVIVLPECSGYKEFSIAQKAVTIEYNGAGHEVWVELNGENIPLGDFDEYVDSNRLSTFRCLGGQWFAE